MEWNVKICNEDKSHVLKDMVFYGKHHAAKRFLIGLSFDFAKYKWFCTCYYKRFCACHLDIASSSLEHRIEMISPEETYLLIAECEEVDIRRRETYSRKEDAVDDDFLSLDAEAFLRSLERRFDIYDTSRFVIEEDDFCSNISKDLYQIIYINRKENNYTKNHKRTAYSLASSLKEAADNFALENDIFEDDILAIRKCEEDPKWPDFVHKFYTEACVIGLNEKNTEFALDKIRDFKDSFGWYDVDDRWKPQKDVYEQRRKEFWNHWEI